MATYLQGVTDYIPDFQPFQPDLNFYANVLQTKQNQYDTNYKALNNLYGELYHQRVTRDDSNKMKDDYLKKVDFELKRVSALDLSLEQNVQQAQQVFKPLYENKHLMKDMALTKNYDLEKGKAMALKNNKDIKQRELYWDVGIKGMDYRLDEFKNALKEDVLSFDNITYTPNVNVYEKYKELSKDINIDITSPDKSGMYLVRQKNGDLIIPSLQKLFLSTYASDPALQAKYATEAYVARKDDIEKRAAKYNNNKILAEQEYLKEKYVILKEYANQKTDDSEDALDASTTKQSIVQNEVEAGDVNPRQPAFLERINQAIQVDKIVYEHNSKLNSEINSGKTSLYTDKPLADPTGLDIDNIELARQIVDSNYATFLAEKDILTYSSTLAERDKIIDYKVNPIGLENMRHMHNMQRDANNNNFALQRDKIKFQNDLYLAKLKNEADEKNAILEWQLDNGLAEVKDGQIVPVETPGQSFESIDGGNTENRNIKVDKDNRSILLDNTQSQSSEYFDTWLQIMRSGIKKGEIKKADLSYLMGQNEKWADKIWEKYNNQADDKQSRNDLVQNLLLSAKIFDLKKRMDNWSARNRGLSVADAYNMDGLRAQMKLEQVKNIYKLHIGIKKDNNQRIQSALYNALSQTTLSDKTKYSIIDAYIKKYRTAKIYDDDDFDDLVNDFIDKYDKSSKTVKVDWKTVDPRMAQYATPEKETSKVSWAKLLNDVYDPLVSNPNHKVGLLSYRGTTSTSNTGEATIGSRPTSVPVNFGAKNDNLIMFKQFVNDLKGINFTNDTESYRISTKGNVYEKNYDLTDTDKLKRLKNLAFDLDALSYQKSQKDKPNIFKLVQHQVGMENSYLGAMTIKNIPDEVLYKYFDKTNDAAIIKEIKANGITYIAPQSNWKNGLFQSNKISANEMILNTGKTIQYIDPMYGHKFNITRDKATGNYNFNTEINYVDENGNPQKETESLPIAALGNAIDGEIEKYISQFTKLSKANEENFKYFQSVGNTEATQKMIKAFGKGFKNSGFKIID